MSENNTHTDEISVGLVAFEGFLAFVVCDWVACGFCALCRNKEFYRNQEYLGLIIIGMSMLLYPIIEMAWGIFVKKKLGLRRILLSIVASILVCLSVLVAPRIFANLSNDTTKSLHSIFRFISQGGIITPDASDVFIADKSGDHMPQVKYIVLSVLYTLISFVFIPLGYKALRKPCRDQSKEIYLGANVFSIISILLFLIYQTLHIMNSVSEMNSSVIIWIAFILSNIWIVYTYPKSFFEFYIFAVFLYIGFMFWPYVGIFYTFVAPMILAYIVIIFCGLFLLGGAMGGVPSASSSNESDDESLYGKVVKSEKERAFYEGRLTQDGWEISSDGQYMENKYGAGGLGITGERRAIRENDGHIVDEYGQRHIPATPFNTDKDDL